jgi:hypothetical protein
MCREGTLAKQHRMRPHVRAEIMSELALVLNRRGISFFTYRGLVQRLDSELPFFTSGRREPHHAS